MEEYEPRGCSKGIEFLVVDDKKMVIKILRPCHLKGFPAQFIDILDDIRLIYERKFLANHSEKLLPNILLFSNGKAENRIDPVSTL